MGFFNDIGRGFKKFESQVKKVSNKGVRGVKTGVNKGVGGIKKADRVVSRGINKGIRGAVRGTTKGVGKGIDKSFEGAQKIVGVLKKRQKNNKKNKPRRSIKKRKPVSDKPFNERPFTPINRKLPRGLQQAPRIRGFSAGNKLETGRGSVHSIQANTRPRNRFNIHSFPDVIDMRGNKIGQSGTGHDHMM